MRAHSFVRTCDGSGHYGGIENVRHISVDEYPANGWIAQIFFFGCYSFSDEEESL